MNAAPSTLESAVEAFVEARRSDATLGAREFAALHPELGHELLETLEALQRIEHAFAPPPKQIGDFRIVRELGRGGMGVVYEAIEAPLERRVALKLLPREMLGSSAARLRFQREAALAARLDHEGICTVFGAGVLDGQPWIALRHVAGETLGRRIANARAEGRGPLRLPGDSLGDPWRSVAACVARIARALAAAHAQGVLHRDVKPANVMVTAAGAPVLLDFGLALERESDAARLTRTGELAGTPAYLAPELIAGDIAHPDALCDVYALGVTLYECLTLQAPFQAPTRAALYRAAVEHDAPDVRSALPDAPRDLAVIVATALQRERALRYSSAESLALDLEAFVEHRPISARPIGTWGKLARWVRREPRQALLSASLVLAALVAAISAGVLLASREQVRASQVAQRAKELDQAVFEAFLDLGEKRRERALAGFERVLRSAPDSDEARVGAVVALVRLKRNDEALELLREAPPTRAYAALRAFVAGEPPTLEDPPWLAEASAHELFLDGERLRLAGERRPLSEQRAWMELALQRYDEAVVRAPRAHPLYHQLRGWAASSAGDLRATRSAANALATLWPDSAVALYQAGSSLSTLDARASLPLLERAAQLDPKRAATFQCIGVAQFQLGELEAARAALARALELEPRNAFAHNALACVFGELGCRDEQRAELQAAFASDPTLLPVLSNLALVDWEAGEVESAAGTLERLLERDPGLRAQRQFYAQVLNALGQPEAGRDQCAIALALAPSEAELWLEFSKHCIAAGEPQDAVDAVEIAGALDPRVPGLEADAAMARAALERRAELSKTP
jgi:tetratricopeptide (TPR) repeat protein/tRNA A-37 threonylcarbamoyl transferase component Bud32